MKDAAVSSAMVSSNDEQGSLLGQGLLIARRNNLYIRHYTIEG